MQCKLTNRKRLRLRCKECKRIFIIRTTNPEIYTPEIKNNWKCIFCSEKNKKISENSENSHKLLSVNKINKNKKFQHTENNFSEKQLVLFSGK